MEDQIDGRFRCTLCGKAFNLKQNLERHILIHTDPGSYRCGICEITCTQRSNLKKHSATHSDPDRIRCTFCGKLF